MIPVSALNDMDLVIFINSMILNGHTVLQIDNLDTLVGSTLYFDQVLGFHSSLVAPMGGKWSVSDLVNFQIVGRGISLYSQSFIFDNSIIGEDVQSLQGIANLLDSTSKSSFIGLWDGYDPAASRGLLPVIQYALSQGMSVASYQTCASISNIMIPGESHPSIIL